MQQDYLNREYEMQGYFGGKKKLVMVVLGKALLKFSVITENRQ